MDWASLVLSVVVFIIGLVLLQYGADAFIDNTALVARRIGVSEILIALLTAGAEWEELAVVVASIIQHKPTLGLGNVIGSCVGNVLGAFSLGLLAGGSMQFDRTAKIYATAQFVVTSFFTALAFNGGLNLTGGILSLVTFFVYLFSVAEGIYEGFMTPPEVEIEDDDDRGDDGAQADDMGEEETIESRAQMLEQERQHAELRITVYPSVVACAPDESTSLLHPTQETPVLPPSVQHKNHSTLYCVAKLFIGITAVTLSGFLLSQSASVLATALGLSNTVVGMTILSFATTLPEKFISVLSGIRGRAGVLVASTAGCNIFLLTLCLGIIFVSGGDSGNEEVAKSILPFEIWCCWGCSATLMIITWIGGRPWIGWLLLGCYGGFLACELTIYRR